MNIKRGMLLVTMALAMVAFSAPATASAATVATFTDGGLPLTDLVIKATGEKIKFETLGEGIECEVAIEITVNKDLNELTTFAIKTSTCVFFGNHFKWCDFEDTDGDTVTNLPWTLDPLTEGATDILTVTGNDTNGKEARIDMKFKEKIKGTNCTPEETTLTMNPEEGRDITLTGVTSGGFLTSFTVGGSITSDSKMGNNVVAGVKGTVKLEKTNTFTYS